MSTHELNTDVAYVALGSNVGHRGQALARLRSALALDGVTIEAASQEVLTRPVGVTAQEDFHNQVVRLRSVQPWSPEQWLAHCKAAEGAAGRRETYRWGPRRADADILLLGERGDIRVDTAELTVPHRELPNRPFLRRLLGEIDPALGDI
jgi:2-amino-4-hydroxy-6-hydroxymethyldihydropteridine diphosphokinase